MRIFLHELNDQETELHFTQEDSWVVAAVERVDERPEENTLLAKRKPTLKRPIEAEFSLRKVDEVVVVNGQITTEISLLCSRCAAPFRMKSSPAFSALFCKDPVMAGIAHLEISQGSSKPAGQNKGFARHAHDFSADEAGEKTGETSQDLDITYLSQDFIELGDVLTEQLRLEVPFQPLCKESCQGICTQCGADLNAGRCACAKLVRQTPFAALKNLKL